MKNRATWMTAPLLALALAACGKKEETAAPPPAAEPVPVQAQADAPPAPPTPPPAPKTPALSPDERAAKLGFVRHLPQDTEVVMAFHNGSKTADRIAASKLWQVLSTELGMGLMPGAMDAGEEEMLEEDMEPLDVEQDPDVPAVDEAAADEALADAEPMGPAKLFGTEFTIAVGKGTAVQSGNLLTLNRRLGYFQMRGLATAFMSAVKSGDFSTMESAMEEQMNEELFKNLLSDSESGVTLFEKMGMPPVYLAFRTSAEDRDSAAQQLASLAENLGMLGDVVEPVEVDKDGSKFAGQKISGAKVSAMMTDSREDIEEMLEPAMVDKLIAAVAKKDLVVVSGAIGEYVVLFIGGSIDDLRFAPSVGESMVAGDTLAFCDALATKDLAAVISGRKEMIDTLTVAAGGLADMANGLRDGIAAADGSGGDTRDLEALLRMVAERESAVRKLVTNDAVGMAAFFEDGLKIESFGGTDNGAIDWKATHKLGALGDSADVVMFANMTTEAAYDEKARDYLEALMETAYAIAMKVAEVPGGEGQIVQFKEMAKTFDTQFRPDMVALWQAISGDFSAGLGNESAWVVDLNGSMPTIPGIPQPIVDEGKFPRISMVAPVSDRAKLASSWTSMNTTVTGMLAKISEMAGEDIPMQKPLSSEKNGLTTWFFPLPSFNDDFVPSVTVGDQWFAASTSKNQALDLIGKAAQPGTARTGLYFSMNFKALQTFCTETIKVLEKNSEELPISKEDIEKATRILAAMDELDSLTAHSRREGGVLRTSVHFKTR